MRRSSFFVAAIATLLCGASLSAHRMDEYLQAARIGIEPGRVDLQLDLTPGVAVMDSIVAAIDRDRDNRLSEAEQEAYVSSVMKGVGLAIDGRTLTVGSITSTFPELDTLRRGEGVIQLRASAALPALEDGAHELAFRNSHRQDVSVYLANALVPASDRVAIHAQRRDQAQVALAIDFTLGSAPSPAHTSIVALMVMLVAIIVAIRRQAF